ncbi:MAG: ABC-F family ATP-binding cassette domain-containing protein [Clostridia bacterium]|nr:ABC-F family ATP-binding cassette domain-containing protein [Clostridia bacterium]
MAVLSVQNLKMEFGERVLFDSVNFEVGEREKIGFIGSNASGKTTLFKLIIGELEPSDGEIFKGKNINIGYLEQHACANSTKTVYDEAESVFESLAEAERRIEELSDMMNSGAGDIDSLIAQQQRLQAEFENGGGLTYKSRTRSMLTGLGFAQEDFSLECSKLSGGQRSKLALGKLLLSEPDLILLDEPTNHIDLLSLEWLENFLKDFKGSAIIISHDRYFLDNVTTKTMHLDHERLTVWNGGYSRFLEQKTERDEIERRHYERQMDEVHRLEGIIEQQKRWRHYITAESKQKMLDKKLAEVTAPQNENKTLGFSFGEVSSTGNEVLNVFGLSKSFGENHLFKGVEFGIRKGDRAFLLGANGCGKTTLLKILMGFEDADSGTFGFGAGVKPGYFDQTLSSLDYSKTAIDEIWDAHRDFTETRVRTLLGQFLFSGDDVYKRIEYLSGGEKARLSILKLMLSGANFLLLDEPTNHLDIPSREALEEALMQFGGTMLVVSHDRYFINKLSSRVLCIGMQGTQAFDGGYDAYAERLTASVQVKVKTKTVGKGGEDYKRRKEQESELRKVTTAIKRSEERINDIDVEITNANEELSRPETSADYERVMELTGLIDSLNSEQMQLMSEWESLENRKSELEELLGIE